MFYTLLNISQIHIIISDGITLAAILCRNDTTSVVTTGSPSLNPFIAVLATPLSCTASGKCRILFLPVVFFPAVFMNSVSLIPVRTYRRNSYALRQKLYTQCSAVTIEKCLCCGIYIQIRKGLECGC